MKKITSMILSFLVVFSFVVGNVGQVNADEVNPTFRKGGIFVNGQKLTKGQGFTTTSPDGTVGSVSYSEDGKTLTLENVYLDKACTIYNEENTFDDKAVIFAYNGAITNGGLGLERIYFKGNNVIKGVDTRMSTYGIYVWGNGCFTGEKDATLTIEAGTAGYQNTDTNKGDAVSAAIFAKQLWMYRGIYKVSGGNSTGRSLGLFVEYTDDALHIYEDCIVDASGLTKPIYVTNNKNITVETKCNNSTDDTDQDGKVHIGHTLKETAAKDATCIETGNHKYYECTTCDDGKRYKDSSAYKTYTETDDDKSSISALGHINPIYYMPTKEATCTEYGKLEHYYCNRCNKNFTDSNATKEVTEKDLQLPKTNHDWDDGVVSIDGDVKTITYTCKDCKVTKTETSTAISKDKTDNVLNQTTNKLVEQVTNNTTNVTAISSETAEKLKIAIDSNKTITTEVKVETVKEDTLDKEQVSKIKELAKDNEVALFLDLSVLLKADNETLGTINELTEEIEFTIDVPEELIKDGRTFYIIRLHNGKAERIDGTLKDGKFTFKTSKFSTYALAYVESPKATTAIKTGDNTNTMLYVGLAAIALLGCAFILYKTKESK